MKTVFEEYGIETTYYVITENPRDYPGKFVVRAWLIREADPIPTGVQYVCENLEEARSHIPEGFFKMKRHPGDDPVIVETWL